MDQNQTEVLSSMERTLIECGCTPARARQIVRTAAQRYGVRETGVGQGTVLTTMKEVGESEAVKATREAVSPWLWVLSVASFLRNFFGKR